MLVSKHWIVGGVLVLAACGDSGSTSATEGASDGGSGSSGASNSASATETTVGSNSLSDSATEPTGGSNSLSDSQVSVTDATDSNSASATVTATDSNSNSATDSASATDTTSVTTATTTTGDTSTGTTAGVDTDTAGSSSTGDAPLLSPFLLWRVVLVSVLFMAIGLGMFFAALGRGHDLATARTIVVNTVVVLEIFYLFNVRYMHRTSISLRGALGTPAVLAAIAVVVAAQLLFTYAPLMHELFDSRPVALADGIAIILVGVALMLVLEGEKILMRRLGLFDELRSYPQAGAAG